MVSQVNGSRAINIPSDDAFPLQGQVLARLGVPEDPPGPVAEGGDGEGGLERVGKGPGGAVPLPGVEHGHPELAELGYASRIIHQGGSQLTAAHGALLSLP